MEAIVIVLVVVIMVLYFLNSDNSTSSNDLPGVQKAKDAFQKLSTANKERMQKCINDVVFIVKNNVKYLPDDVKNLEYSKKTINAFVFYYVSGVLSKEFSQENSYVLLTLILDRLNQDSILKFEDFNVRIFRDDEFATMPAMLQLSGNLPIQDNTLILVFIEKYMERKTGKRVRYMYGNNSQVEVKRNVNINGINDNNMQLYKEITSKKFEELSLSMAKYFRNQNHNIQYFFSFFPLLQIKPGYVLTSYTSDDGVVCPYIKKENEIYGKEELNNLPYRKNNEENVSFSKNMDKIVFDRNNPDACFELLVFNYYVSLFFFVANEYGGKIIMTELEKINISKRHGAELHYSPEERQKILKTNIPRKIAYNNDGTISISMITTDASYEILLSEYKITTNNEIYKIDNDIIVELKILY